MGPVSKRLRTAALGRRIGRFFVMIAPPTIGLALVVGLCVPAAHAEDCASLDIHLGSDAGYKDVKCESSDSMSEGTSATEETIRATDSRSIFLIRHDGAGNRTYLHQSDTQSLIKPVFEKSEGWTSAPGGNKFLATRFKGWFKSTGSAFECFAFSRFTGHVDHSMGYRHAVYGFYCAAQPDTVSDADVRRLIGALTFNFE
ncbi:MAG TPA: hypothetical protein VMQ73_19330 [Methylomirabilota bacterium]|nr:hypothetical protein [Methylomirabilota bacterium]